MDPFVPRKSVVQLGVMGTVNQRAQARGADPRWQRAGELLQQYNGHMKHTPWSDVPRVTEKYSLLLGEQQRRLQSIDLSHNVDPMKGALVFNEYMPATAFDMVKELFRDIGEHIKTEEHIVPPEIRGQLALTHSTLDTDLHAIELASKMSGVDDWHLVQEAQWAAGEILERFNGLVRLNTRALMEVADNLDRGDHHFLEIRDQIRRHANIMMHVSRQIGHHSTFVREAMDAGEVLPSVAARGQQVAAALEGACKHLMEHCAIDDERSGGAPSRLFGAVKKLTMGQTHTHAWDEKIAQEEMERQRRVGENLNRQRMKG